MINQVKNTKIEAQNETSQTQQTENKKIDVSSVFTTPVTKISLGFGKQIGENIKNAYETGNEITGGSIFASPLLKTTIGAGKEFGGDILDIYEKGKEAVGDNVFISPVTKFAVGLGQGIGEDIQDAYAAGEEICNSTNIDKDNILKACTGGLVGGIAGFFKELFA